MPASPSLRAVLFDAGGVLVGPNWRRLAAWLVDAGVPVDESSLAAVEHRALQVGLHGETDREKWCSYLSNVCELALGEGGPRVPLEVLQEAYAVHSQPQGHFWDLAFPDVRPCLEALRGRCLLGVVSNSSGVLESVLHRLDLARYFRVILDSAVVGVAKPDPAIFHMALEALSVEAGETLYVGDVPEIDVEGARRAGVRALLLDRAWMLGEHLGSRVRGLDELPGWLGAEWSRR